MKVIQFSEFGGPEVLQSAEVPTLNPPENSIRVRIRAAAVNPADTKWRAGMFRGISEIPIPHVLGYDIAGTVDALGSGVSEFVVGDRVVGKLNPLTKGGYAEFALIPASDAVSLPSELDFATASAIPTAGLTGTQMVQDYADVQSGSTVLVTGALGAVGRFAVHAAQKRGATVIAAVRRSQEEEVRSLAVDEIIVLGEANWLGAPFDFVLDTVGGSGVAQLCQHLAPGGRIFTASTTPISGATLPSEPVFVMVRDDPAQLAALVREVAAKQLIVPVARKLPLENAAEAHRLVEAGGSGGKIVLEP